MVMSICLLLILLFSALRPALSLNPYTFQELQPVILNHNSQQIYSQGNNYNDFKDVRITGPKRKSYPILDQFESKLYPRHNFKKENPSRRLERLEIAVFGNKQKGSIKKRVTSLKAELEAWQIANEQVSEILDSKRRAQKRRKEKQKRQELANLRVPRLETKNQSYRKDNTQGSNTINWTPILNTTLRTILHR